MIIGSPENTDLGKHRRFFTSCKFKQFFHNQKLHLSEWLPSGWARSRGEEEHFSGVSAPNTSAASTQVTEHFLICNRKASNLSQLFSITICKPFLCTGTGIGSSSWAGQSPLKRPEIFPSALKGTERVQHGPSSASPSFCARSTQS